ncbi:MAG: 30S ribosomal protein S3 [Planctomycetota bacterium]|nr:30S ribosomal protein S3 [Planctomycetota bacterium]
MGHKVRPTSLRLGITRNWSSRWYASKKDFGPLLVQDYRIRNFIKHEFFSAGIPEIEIERSGHQVTIHLHAARPGVVIGKRGAKVEQLREDLQLIIGKEADVRLNIVEVQHPDLNAQLLAENVSDQLRRRMPFRRVLKQMVRVTMESGAKGVKLMLSGRLGGAEIARSEKSSEGSIPLSTIRADVDYGFAEAKTTYGIIGVKAWVYRGEVVNQKKGSGRHGDDAQARQA